MNQNQEDRATHWQQVYLTKGDRETSWHQDDPAVSLELIQLHTSPGARVIDVGGGASVLGGRLLQLGFAVTVVDISPAALERAQQRIGPSASNIQWITGDITQIPSLQPCDLWHDRAVFHFLTDVNDRKNYIDLCARTVVTGGHVVIGTFALDGPEKCSGLPVQRYDAEGIGREFGPAFSLVHAEPHVHITPWGKPQSFVFTVLRRT